MGGTEICPGRTTQGRRKGILSLFGKDRDVGKKKKNCRVAEKKGHLTPRNVDRVDLIKSKGEVTL